MFAWIGAHKDVINVFLNLGILLVWVFYAQLLLANFQRQRRPRVLINQIKGTDLDAQAMISNMSHEAIFVQGLMVRVETDTDTFTHTLTDVETHDADDDAERTQRVTAQGPLASGSYMLLSSFRQLADWIAPGSSGQTDWRALEVRLIFLYGSEGHPIGVVRRFEIQDDDGRRRVRAPDLDATTLASWRHRRRIRRWLRESL